MLQDTKINAIGKYKTSLTFNRHFLKQFFTSLLTGEKTEPPFKKSKREQSIYSYPKYFWLSAHFGSEQHSIIIHDYWRAKVSNVWLH